MSTFHSNTVLKTAKDYSHVARYSRRGATRSSVAAELFTHETLPLDLVVKGKIITMYDAALAAEAAGLNVLPPKEDGSKAPDASSWTGLRDRRSKADEIDDWYGIGPTRTGLGAVMGRISGNLELFEFDGGTEVYEEFKAVARETDLGDLVERIESGYVEESPNGIHWLYRCPDVGASTTLARRPKQTLIETRGEGGYCILAPSHGKVHPSEKPYRLLRGSFDSIVTISAVERRALFELARTFDQMPPRQLIEQRPSAQTSRARPGDDYVASTTWEEVLEPHGWSVVSTRGDTTRWRRPGKRQGPSATVGVHGSDLLYVFSTSTPFDAGRGYNKFSAYALLNHNGDFSAAAGALRAEGYGSHDVTERAPTQDRREETDGGVQVRFHAYRLDEFMNTADEPLDTIISDGGGGAILTSDGKGCVAGATGVGKTNMLLRLARCLCEGEPFLGYPVPRPRRVLYVLLEGSPGTTKLRLEKVWANSAPEDRSRFHLSHGNLDLTNEESLRALHALLASVEPEVLILDPLRDVHSGNENDSAETARLTSILDDIIERFTCAILIAHHDRKRPAYARRDIGADHLRGSTALTGWLSFVLSLRRRSGRADSFVAEWPKTRDAAVALERQILNFDRDTIDFIATRRTRDVRVSEDDVLEMILRHGGSVRGPDFVREVVEGDGGGERFVRDLLRALVEDGRLEAFRAREDRQRSAKSYRLPDGAEQGRVDP